MRSSWHHNKYIYYYYAIWQHSTHLNAVSKDAVKL